MLVMIILAVLSVGMLIYAVFGAPASSLNPEKKKNIKQPLPKENLNKEQKIQRLQNQVADLESQLEAAKAESAKGKSGAMVTKEKEEAFSAELKRREEWVAKAEAELAKIKAENLDLNSKFTGKEKQLQEEFTKNVNLERQIREIKVALEAKEMACRLKEDQIQAQKHQIESQLKSINEHSATIDEFNRKEKISEWVPKAEFNKLNEEYSQLEKDLEASQERLKSFAEEIAHLRQQVAKTSSAESVKPEEAKGTGANPEKTEGQK